MRRGRSRESAKKIRPRSDDRKTLFERKFMFEPLERRIMLSATTHDDAAFQLPAKLAVQASTAGDPAGDHWSHVSRSLQRFYAQLPNKSLTEALADSSLIHDDLGRISIQLYSGNLIEVLPGLAGLGFVTEVVAEELATGWLPSSAIGGLVDLAEDGLSWVEPSSPPITRAGFVDTQGDVTHQADRVRDFFKDNTFIPLDGAGVTVGIISDSFGVTGPTVAYYPGPNSTTLYGNGPEIPGDVLIVGEGAANRDDEGRAMAEIIHDIAPGADIAFMSYVNDDAIMATRLQQLVNEATAHWPSNKLVIVDDIGVTNEYTYQESIWGKKVDDLVTNAGITYFAAAGNDADVAWENVDPNGIPIPFTATVDTLVDVDGGIITDDFHTFGVRNGVPDFRQRVTIAPGVTSSFILTWDDAKNTAGNGVDTDLDIYLVDPRTNQVVGNAGDEFNINIQEPYENAWLKNTSKTPRQLDVVIRHFSGPLPNSFKWTGQQSAITINEFDTETPTIIGHLASDNTFAVAATPYFNQSEVSYFTSEGPAKVLFDVDGNPFPTAQQIRDKPDVAGINAVDTSFFGQNDFDGSGFLNFFGTSAAAPHVAAIAALMWQNDPALSSSQVYQRLKSTAQNIVIPGELPNGWDPLSGFGLVDAYSAVFANVPGKVQVGSLPGNTFTEDFESQRLEKYWEVSTQKGGVVETTNVNEPSYVGQISTNFSGLDGYGEMILHLDLSGLNNVALEFQQKEVGDSDQPMSAKFTGQELSDGVALSVDGTTWYRLKSLIGAESQAHYQNHVIDLSTFATGAGITLGSNVQIKFQNVGDTGMGMVFDNISVFEKQVGGSVYEAIPGPPPSTTLNGMRDPGERGIDRIDVEVRRSSGALEQVVQPGPDGQFAVGGLDPGNYYLQFVPQGRMVTQAPVNNDLLPSTNRTADFSVSSLQEFEVGFISGLTLEQRFQVIEGLESLSPFVIDAAKQAVEEDGSTTNTGLRGLAGIPFVQDIAKQLELDTLMGDLASLLYDRPTITALAAPTLTLANDVHFYAEIDGSKSGVITVPAMTYADEFDLATAINEAIKDAGLDKVLFADVFVDGTNKRLTISSTQSNGRPTLSLTTINLTAGSAPVANGQLTGDLEFDLEVTYDGNLLSTKPTIKILKSDTDDNADASDLAKDVTAALAGLTIDGLPINLRAVVDAAGNLVLVPTDLEITKFKLIHTSGHAGDISELGFANGNQVEETNPHSPLGLVGGSVAGVPAFNTVDSLEDALETAYRTFSTDALDSQVVDADVQINDFSTTTTSDDVLEYNVRVENRFEEDIWLDFFDGVPLGTIPSTTFDLGTLEVAALAEADLQRDIGLDFRMGVHIGDIAEGFQIFPFTPLSTLNLLSGVDLLVGMTADTVIATNGQPGTDVNFTLTIDRDFGVSHSISMTLLKDPDPNDSTLPLDQRKPNTGDNINLSMLVDDLNRLFSQTADPHATATNGKISDVVEAGLHESIDQFGNVTEKLTLLAVDNKVRKLNLAGADFLGFTGSVDSHYADLVISLSDGHSFDVNLDGSTFISDVIAKIETASIVGTSPTVDVVINPAGNGLDVMDMTNGSHTFAIMPAAETVREEQEKVSPFDFNDTQVLQSIAGIGLGILGQDDDTDPNGLPAPDDKIEGTPLHGFTFLDEVYIVEQASGQTANHKHITLSASIESDVDVTAAYSEIALDFVSDPSDPFAAGASTEIHLVDVINIDNLQRIYLRETPLNLPAIIASSAFAASASGTVSLGVNVFDETDRLDLTALLGESDPLLELSFAFDTSTNTYKFTPNVDFTVLGKQFKKLGVEDYARLLESFVEHLQTSFSPATMNTTIPILGETVGDTLAFADGVLDAALELVDAVDLDSVEAALDALETGLSNLGMSVEAREPLLKQLAVLRKTAAIPAAGATSTFLERLPIRLLSAAAQFGKLINRHIPATTDNYDDLIRGYKRLLAEIPALNSLEERIARGLEDKINAALNPPSPLTVNVELGFADFDGDENTDDRVAVLGIELSAPKLANKKFEPSVPLTAELGPVDLELDAELDVFVGGDISVGLAIDPNQNATNRFYLLVNPPDSTTDDLVKTEFNLDVGVDSSATGTAGFGTYSVISAEAEVSFLESVQDEFKDLGNQLMGPNNNQLQLTAKPSYYRGKDTFDADGRHVVVIVKDEVNDAFDVLSFPNGQFQLVPQGSNPPRVEILHSDVPLNNATEIIVSFQSPGVPGPRLDSNDMDRMRAMNSSATIGFSFLPKLSTLSQNFTFNLVPNSGRTLADIVTDLDAGTVAAEVAMAFSNQGLTILSPTPTVITQAEDNLNNGVRWLLTDGEFGYTLVLNGSVMEVYDLPNALGAVPFGDVGADTDFIKDLNGMLLGAIHGSLLGNNVDNIMVLAASLHHLEFPQITFDPEALANLFKLDLDLKRIVQGIDDFLEQLEIGLRDEIIAEMPLAGDGLDMEETFIGKLRKNLTIPLLDLLCNTDGGLLEDIEAEVRQLIFDKLGPANLNILGDQNGDNTVNMSDVDVELTEDKFEIDIQITGRDDFLLDFNFGPRFPLQGDGGLEFGYEFTVELGVGISRADRFYFLDQRDEYDIDNDNDFQEKIDEITLDIFAGLAVDTSGANPIPTSLALDLFGLEISATDILNGSTTGTSISGELTIDVTDPNADGLIKLNELTSRPFADVFEANLTLMAGVNLKLAAGVNDNLPSVETDLFVGNSSGGPWTATLMKGQNNKYTFSQSGLTVKFLDLGINLGDFLSEHLSPLVRSVDRYIEPIKPVINLLTSEVPGISDLSKAAGNGPVYFLDLAFLNNPTAGQQARDFVNTVQAIIDVIDSLAGIDPADNLFVILDPEITVASIPLVALESSTADGSPQTDSQTELTLEDFAAIGDQLQAVSAGGIVTGIKNVPGKLKGLLDKLNDIGIQIHLLEQPTNIVNLLTGKPFDVVSWKLPEFNLPFTFEKSFPVIPFPKIDVRVGLDAEVFAKLSVGYDSHGISTGNFFHGIYFGDRADVFAGADIDEFGLSLGVRLAALLDLVVVKAGVEGEIVGNVVANWNDSDDDGKLHLDEIASIVRHDGIECLFDVSGEVRAIVRAIWEFTITGKTGSKEFINKQIASFNHACPKFETGHVSEGETLPGIDAAIASDPTFSEFNQAGTLVIHAGPFANLRGPGASSDTNESFEVEKIAPKVYVVRGLGLESRYSGVERVYFSGGVGNDRLELINVDDRVVAFGGAGDDHLQGTQHVDFIDGGTGNDEIWARGNSDFVLGGAGDDTIYSDLEPGNTNTTLWGLGAGDMVYAGAGNDRVFAAEGGDTIYGGGGDDVIYADRSEENTPVVNQGSDMVMAGSGNDIVWAGEFGDTVFGEAGNDQLFGEAGIDVMHGGTGADVVIGMGDNDQLHGDSGIDVVVGGLGDDEIFGGRGNDILAGGLATEEPVPNQGAPLRDTVGKVLRNLPLLAELVMLETTDYGSTDGNDTLWGEEDHDLLIGDGGIDSLFGGYGNDVLIGYRIGDTSSNDAIPLSSLFEYFEGGPDNDFICGTHSSDEIYGGTADAGLAHILASVPGTPASGGFNLTSCLATVVDVQLPPTESTIAGVKFNDLNGDGLRGDTEPLLAGWTIHLLDPDGEIIDSAITDADGAYVFVDLPAGDYGLSEEQQPDWVQTTSDHALTLADNEDLTDFDFGNQFNGGTITGQKFHDRMPNGVFDSGEAGLNSWRIELLDAEGNVIDSTITESKDLDNSGVAGDDPAERGFYEFTDLPSGTYGVREVLLDDWVQRSPTHADANAFVYIADDGFSATRSYAFSPVPGTISSVNPVTVTLDIEHPRRGDLEAILVSPDGTRVRLFTNVGGNVQDFAGITFDESNVNAVDITDISANPNAPAFRPEQSLQQLAGETARGSWTLEIYDSFEGERGRLNSWSLNINNTTVNGGTIHFFNAKPTVVVEYEVQAGATVTQNFANFKVATVSGTKFLDSSPNGVQDPGEPGHAGVTIFADFNNNGQVDRGEPTTITEFDDPNTAVDETGRYTLGPFPPGSIIVREVVPDNYLQTFPAPAGGLSGSHQVLFVSGQEVTGIDFGNAPPASIHGTKWFDENGNGVREENEPGLAGITIYADLNNNGQLDEGEPQTLSMQQNPAELLADANGDHTVNFSDLFVWLANYGQNGLPPGEGDFDRSGSVGGSDFLLWQRTVGDTPDNLVGEYWLEVPPGEVTIREIVPRGFEQTYPFEQDHTLFVGSGGVVTGIDFGNFQLEEMLGSIHGLKWHDEVADGIRTPEEPGLANVEIYLDLNNNGRLDAGEPVTITSADDPTTQSVDEAGAYWFTGLQANNYVVREIIPEGTELTYPLSGYHAVRLQPNERVEGVDFGNRLIDQPAPVIDGSTENTLNEQLRLSASHTIAAAMAPNGLVALWDFEQTLDDTASDYDENVGLVNDRLTGSPVYGTGRFGSFALSLEDPAGGLNTHFTQATGDLNPSSFTIETFFKPNGVLSNSFFGTVFAVFDATNTTTGDFFNVFYEPPSAPNPDGTVEVRLRSNGVFQTFGFASVDPNAWSHVALVGDGGDNLAMYVNGQFTGSISLPGASIRIDQNDRIRFGGGELAGLIDKMAIWNLELTEADFVEHYEFPEACYGLTPATTSIHGFKFNDENGDGIWQQSEELPIANWEIYLEVDGGTPQVATTNADGAYWFSGIEGSTARVWEEQRNGWLQTSDGGTSTGTGMLNTVLGVIDWTLDIANQQDYHDVNFGNQNQFGKTHGHKFEDLNGDGIWNGNEQPLADWVIEISGGDLNGDGVVDLNDRRTTVTNAMGEYWFMDLLPGAYTIREFQQQGWMQTSMGGTGFNGNLFPQPGTTEWIIDLNVGEEYFNVDFGNRRDLPPTPLPDGDDTIYASAGDDILIYGDNLVSNPFVISVGSRRDTIYGQAGNDHLYGQEEDDILWGADDFLGQVTLGDNDTLDGGDGIDEVRQLVNENQTLTNASLTGQGTDALLSIERGTLTGGVDNNAIDATAFSGPVSLFGADGNDTLLGGSNDDLFDGGTGDDKLIGGEGDDRYLFSSATSPSEEDTIVELPNEGADTIDFSNVNTSVTVNLSGSLTGNRIAEQPGGVRVVGVMVSGQEANLEHIIGTNANDNLSGNAANNMILALAGSDVVSGGAGNDHIDLGIGTGQSASGGADDDLFVFADGWGTVANLTGGGGSDTVDFSAVTTELLFEIGSLTVSAAGNTVDAPLGDVENLIGGIADDTFRFVADGSALPTGGTIDGRAGSDWLDYIGYTTASANVNLGAGTAIGTSQVISIENILGGAANDIITGDAGVNIIRGRGGDDMLDGGAGGDIYVAVATDGSDTLADSGLATDVDVLDLSGAVTDLRLNIQAAQITVDYLANTDQLTSTNTLEEIYLGTGNDEVLVFANASLPANASIDAGEGIDTLDYTNHTNARALVNLSDQDHPDSNTPLILARQATGIDQVNAFENVKGTSQNDVLVGNYADNQLWGFAGNDELFGLSGNDTLLGGIGINVMTGGNGDDLYIVDPAPNSFSINEFTGTSTQGQATGGGIDTVDFSAVASLPVPIDISGSPNIENIIGSATGPNVIIGNSKNNLLIGGTASDRILGGDGNDIIAGLGSADWIEGEAGNDVLIGDAGADGTGTISGNPRVFSGGAGRDILVGGTGADNMTAADGEEDIVINGSTVYDDVTVEVNREAWNAIRDIWQSTSRTRALRMTLIETGVGTVASGGPFRLLEGVTVSSDAQTDTYSIDDSSISGSVDDWVFRGVGDPLLAGVSSALTNGSVSSQSNLRLHSLIGTQQFAWTEGYRPERRTRLVEKDRVLEGFHPLLADKHLLSNNDLLDLEESRVRREPKDSEALDNSEDLETLDSVFAGL